MEGNQPEAARAALLDDSEVQVIREECLRQFAAGLAAVGERLHVAGALIGAEIGATGPRDSHLTGMGLVAQTGASLLQGFQSCLDLDNAYAAAALLRQVVEVEYLAWAFANDQAEASLWLKSTKEERLKRWQPRHLRERSQNRFRAKDYGRHCENGGHPSPGGGASLLKGPAELNRAGLTCDALTHGRSLWHYLMEAVELYASAKGWSVDGLLESRDMVAASNAVESWWEYDPFKPFIVAGLTGDGPSAGV